MKFFIGTVCVVGATLGSLVHVTQKGTDSDIPPRQENPGVVEDKFQTRDCTCIDKNKGPDGVCTVFDCRPEVKEKNKAEREKTR